MGSATGPHYTGAALQVRVPMRGLDFELGKRGFRLQLITNLNRRIVILALVSNARLAPLRQQHMLQYCTPSYGLKTYRMARFDLRSYNDPFWKSLLKALVKAIGTVSDDDTRPSNGKGVINSSRFVMVMSEVSPIFIIGIIAPISKGSDELFKKPSQL